MRFQLFFQLIRHIMAFWGNQKILDDGSKMGAARKSLPSVRHYILCITLESLLEFVRKRAGWGQPHRRSQTIRKRPTSIRLIITSLNKSMQLTIQFRCKMESFHYSHEYHLRTGTISFVLPGILEQQILSRRREDKYMLEEH